jgi:hypothetical protein
MTADAVIFIPGIKGTKLVETNKTPFDTIWSGIQSNFETIEDLELTGISAEGAFDKKINNIIKPGEIEELAYGEFIQDLDVALPKFIFNYDWRLSAQTNGHRLHEFIQYLIEKSAATEGYKPFKKFHVITHSLGNFILRAYLAKQGMGLIDKIVFTVPPFRGSLDILSAALIGEGFFPNVKSTIRKVIRSMPGAMELLPSYEEYARFDSGGKVNFFNPKHWQSNVPMDSDEKLKNVLAIAKRTSTGDALQDLATLTAAERKRILVIARGGFDTFQAVPVVKTGTGNVDNFVDWEYAVRNKQGDGRVPHASSCCYHDKVKTIMLEDAFWFRDYSHGFVLKDERLQKIVHRFLNKGAAFDHSIPGGSVKQVVGLELVKPAAPSEPHTAFGSLFGEDTKPVKNYKLQYWHVKLQ